MTLREKVEALATEWEALGNAPVRFAFYQHGIQTVINSLTAAAERGLADTQVLALHAMGAPALAPSIATRLGPHCTEGDEETLAHTTNACKEIER
jgi:hypothetical protein